MLSIDSTSLFGSSTRTQTLLIVRMLGETHSAEIANILGRTRSRIKDAVDTLEMEGVITGAKFGGARKLTINPRYVAAEELCALLDKLALNDVELQRKLGEVRRRPRRARKPL